MSEPREITTNDVLDAFGLVSDEELGTALPTSPRHDCQNLDEWDECWCFEE